MFSHGGKESADCREENISRVGVYLKKEMCQQGIKKSKVKICLIENSALKKSAIFDNILKWYLFTDVFTLYQICSTGDNT